MRVADLVEVLKIARVDPTYYAIGDERHECLCIVSVDDGWKVFLSERGSRYEEKSFESEDDACVYFLKRLFQLARSP